MTLASRSQLLTDIGNHLNCPVLAYVTGDRSGLQTQIGADQVAFLPRHIASLGTHDTIAVLVYTRGGDTNVPWSVVSLLREQCDRLLALVPAVAHSAGTLLCLGADEILMTRVGTLSPIDPTVANAFNPVDPANPTNRTAIAVEDVLAFLELAKENVTDSAFDRAFEQLCQQVHPLALGNVKRSISQIRQLAKKLISLHPPDHDDDELQALVTRLTTEFYSHQHLVSRKEGRELGLPIVDTDPQLEGLLLGYLEELKMDLELLDPFNPANILRVAGALPPAAAPVAAIGPTTAVPPPIAPPAAGAPAPVPVTVERGYLETSTTCDAFVTRGAVAPQIVMSPTGPQQAIAFDIHTEKWEHLA